MKTTLHVLILVLLGSTVIAADDLDSRIATLETRLPTMLDAADIPGIQIAAVDGDAIVWQRALGIARLSDGRRVDLDTLFESASLSKPVFARIAFDEVAAERLDLDRPIDASFAYERIAHEPRAKTITATHALGHSSGMPNWQDEPLATTPIDLMFAPGERFGYSGEGYVYLQKAIEHATGKTLQTLAEERVFKPLAMRQSSFIWSEQVGAAAADGHDRFGSPRPLHNADAGISASSLFTTAGEYARFLRDELARADHPGFQPVTPIVLDRQGEPMPEGVLSWAPGWGIYQHEGRKLVWHWGDNGQFRGFVAAEPETRRGIVFFTNSQNGLRLIEPIVRTFFDLELDTLLSWLGYREYDEEKLLAKNRIRQIFLDQGTEMGLVAFSEAIRNEPDEGLVLTLTGELRAHDLPDAAAGVLERFTTMHGDASADVWGTLGQYRADRGEYGAALEALEAALALDPEDEPRQRWVTWVQDLERVSAEPISLPATQRDKWVGTYGPRAVMAEGDALYYQRAPNPRYKLIPLSDDTFALEGLTFFRFRIETDESGAPTRIVGMYVDGREDHSPRDPG
ncbi:MAG: serine hydrolase domain-containing protein [Acidobacteriota bacterium]